MKATKESAGKKAGSGGAKIGKAISMLAHKFGRAVYHVWRRQEVFDENYFWQQAMIE